MTEEGRNEGRHATRARALTPGMGISALTWVHNPHVTDAVMTELGNASVSLRIASQSVAVGFVGHY